LSPKDESRSLMMNSKTKLSALLFFAALATPLGAQTGASISASTNPFYRHRPLEEGDSVAIFRAVRSRQLAFERFRRENFPDAEARTQRIDCADVIGRFCYNHSEELSNWGPEDDAVLAARTVLIAAFDTAVAWQPGDEWIARQRIRYLVEAGEHDKALEIVEQCALSDTWECYALAGYVQHHAELFAAAESFFDQALHAMPEETRCEWTNITSILPEEIAEDYSESTCEERLISNKRLWWLADPLYLIQGNERRSEHFSRMVLNRMLQRAESGFGIWETDLRELLTRYGWPAEWENVMVGRNGAWQEEAVVSRHLPSARSFIPISRVFRDPTTTKWFEWPLDEDEARSRYAPSYAEVFDYLETHQVVPFRRADSSIVVAAFNWQWDEMPDSVQIDWATVLTENDSAPMTVVDGVSPTGRVSTIMSGGLDPAVMSVEALSADNERAARIRFGIAPPEIPDEGLGISQILLFDPPSPLPLEVSDVARHALSSSILAPGSQLGLYWEVYGLSEGTDSLTTTVTVVKGGRNLFSRLAGGIGLGGSGAEVAIDWTEPTGASVFALPHSVGIDLAGLEPGNYAVRVEAVSSGGDRITMEQPIEIRRP
jgi:tetratricopeptide (TPR) repeat protein